MFDTMPEPQHNANGVSLPRNDSFSTEDIARAFQASALKPRNHLSLKIVQQDELEVPPPTPHESSSIMMAYTTVDRTRRQN